MRTIHLLTVPIHILTDNELDARFTECIAGNRARHIVTVNPEYLVEAYRNEAFRGLLATADLSTADGTGIILAAKALGYPVKLSDRLTGVELTKRLLAFARNQALAVLILLRRDSLTAETRLAETLSRRYPGVRFSIMREPVTMAKINAFRPVIVFCAFGSPQQDTWLRTHTHEIPSMRIALGVGGTFDFISGRIKRAPAVMRIAGLEWLWRFAREPKRIRRIAQAVIVFPWLIARHR